MGDAVGMRLMVVRVGGRVKLANDVTYKRYAYCPKGKGKGMGMGIG